MKTSEAIKRLLALLRETADEWQRDALEAAIVGLAAELESEPQGVPMLVPYPVPYYPDQPYHPWRLYEPVIWDMTTQRSTFNLPPGWRITVNGIQLPEPKRYVQYAGTNSGVSTLV